VELRGSCWSPGGGFRAPFPTRPRMGGFVAGLEPYRTTGRWTGPGGQGVPRGAGSLRVWGRKPVPGPRPGPQAPHSRHRDWAKQPQLLSAEASRWVRSAAPAARTEVTEKPAARAVCRGRFCKASLRAGAVPRIWLAAGRGWGFLFRCTSPCLSSAAFCCALCSSWG